MSYAMSASLYDAIYEDMKDYPKEAERVHELIQAHKRINGNSLLNIAGGTGLHDQYLRGWYDGEVLDSSKEMLAIAARRLPGIILHEADMRTFRLKKRFMATTCLFSAIGHMKDVDELNMAVANFSRHTLPGGVVIVEPWITPDMFDPAKGFSTQLVKDKRVARICESNRHGNVVQLQMHHFFGWPDKPQYVFEYHRVTMFTHDEYMAAFTAAGLDVVYDVQGLMGRGLYIGRKPL